MDKFPLVWEGRPMGELTAEPEALYTWFTARCRLPGRGLWCAWAVGDRGELRLGILEPEGERAAIRRRFSDRMTAPMGKILRGEVRPANGEEGEHWSAVPEPERLFRASWLRRQLQGVRGALTRTERGRHYLALPYDRGSPFPLPTLFCFAQIRRIGGSWYAVYAFDAQERPVF